MSTQVLFIFEKIPLYVELSTLSNADVQTRTFYDASSLLAFTAFGLVTSDGINGRKHRIFFSSSKFSNLSPSIFSTSFYWTWIVYSFTTTMFKWFKLVLQEQVVVNFKGWSWFYDLVEILFIRLRLVALLGLFVV